MAEITKEVFQAATGVTKEFIQATTDITDNLPKVIANLKSTATEVSKSVDSAIQGVERLKQREVVLNYKTIHACNKLAIVVTQADDYINSLNNFFYYGRQLAEQVREEIKQSKYSALNNLLAQLNRSMSKAETHYQKFSTSCEEAKDSCIQAAEEAKIKKNEAQRQRRVTRGVGGTIAAISFVAGVGSGVTLSVLAGVLTLGVGAVVGLSVTAGVTALGGTALGTGTAIVTHVIASDFEKTETALTSLCSTRESMQQLSCNLLDCMAKAHSKVNDLSSLIDDVDQNEKNAQNSVLIAAVNRMLKLFEDYYQDSSSCQSLVSSKRQELESTVKSLYG